MCGMANGQATTVARGARGLQLTAGLLAVVLAAGLGIGMTGIGGVLVVPGLGMLGGVPITRAVPASTFAFLFTGVAALQHVQWARRRAVADATAPATLPPSALWALLVAALAGAGLGALSLRWLPALVLHSGVALLALGSGLQALLARPPADGPARTPAAGALAAIGLLVGIGSAWSGTGGPILLLPLLLWRGTPTRAAIAMAQAVQLPIALAATAVNWRTGLLDIPLGLGLGALLVLGWLAGVALAARVPTAALRTGLGGLLVGVGLWYGLQTLAR